MNFDLDRALATSCAIYRSKQNQSFQENKVVVSSKQLLKEILTLTPAEFDNIGKDCRDYIDSVYIIPTDQDYECAKQITKHFRKLSFGILGENLSDFMQKVFLITQSEKIKSSDLGIIATIPKVYFDDVEKTDFQKQLKSTSNNYVGIIGNKVTVTCVIVKIKFVENFNCYSHTAITSQNELISWLNKKQAGFKNDIITITGKVKSHQFYWGTNIPETQLNYVKYQ